VTDPAVTIATPFIARFEGYRSHPYDDGFGTWTIGYGTTFLEDGTAVTEHTSPMTKAEALTYLAAFVGRLAPVIRTMSRPVLTDNQCAGFCSFAYEEGISALADSKLMSAWNSGDVAEAEAQWLVWDVAGGRAIEAIEARRKAELTLFKTPNGPPAVEDEADALMDRLD
jgi:lysozyme